MSNHRQKTVYPILRNFLNTEQLVKLGADKNFYHRCGPPKTGTLAATLDIACVIPCPFGALRKPPTVCQIEPPIRPIE